MKKNHHLYATRFENHVLMFIKEYRLLDSGKKLALAASAGVDSLSLARILFEAKIPFELLHFNHGTRAADNRKEEALIRYLGSSYNVPVKVIAGSFSLEQKNFEHEARLWRKKHYEKLMAENYLIMTAHHLDDSYEWSLMQSSKQGSLKSTLGIPVKAHGIRRPLMCVSKKQILRYARARKLDWLEDSSNQNTNFERNYVRLKITKKLKEKYPRLLRHYVAQKNELAQILGVHSKGSQVLEFHLEEDESGGLCFSAHSMQPHKARIKEALKFYSTKSRGEIDHELDKLIAAHADLQKNLKQLRFKGPMSFTGGVEVYLCHEDLFIIGQKQKEFYKELDEKLVHYLESQPQIPFSVTKCYPHLVIGKNILVKNSMQFVHSLLPKTCAWLKNKKVPYTFAPVLKKDIQQKLLQSAVVLASSDIAI